MSRRQRDRALVDNASDPGQVQAAKQRQTLRRDREMDDLRAVVASPAGERFLRRVLEHVGTFRSVWSPSAAIHFQAGQQDVGHWLMGEIGEADADALARITVAAYTEDTNG